MKIRYKVTLLSISILLICSIMLGTSYALWTTTATQQGENVVNVGCFKITFIETGFSDAGQINLTNEYPVTDSKGAEKQPYKFTIKNECSVAAAYNVNLETLVASTMNNSYLKVRLNDNSPVIYDSGLEPTTPYLGEDASSARKLVSGYLSDGQSVTYSLRLWIDYSAETTSENVMGTSYIGKITVYSQATKTNNPGIPYTGPGESFTQFLIDHDMQYQSGVDPATYILFNDELWRVGQAYAGMGMGIVKDEPIEGYTFDYDNIKSYTTSPFIKTETVNGVQTTINYYDTLSETAKSMITAYPYAIGTISDNNMSLSDVHSATQNDTTTLVISTLTVSNFIYTNSLTSCYNYNFGTDLNTNKCTQTSYAIGNDYVYTLTKGPNGLYIVSNRGVREKTADFTEEVKITPTTAFDTSILVTGGSGTKTDPYTVAKSN